ncbi:uncharacterized protein BDW47DRAFT_104262 [Aspergillus candidus]|uniref:Uncharacterized protein n=1 Tax=Aspergillus candidus TaxID=41067 RepID=A0A2I2FDR9_ASPCN|nr:hypothetical protein BDW47DRAFT_104262 [Aspergillus candidus]PLB38772.1 hypothetical protein BDW47DRAFT_104262 [Aspergillus candidus]
MAFYFPRTWRNHNLVYIFMAIELPLTIIILTFTGIASHDLYRTKLWQDGADNGFNSSPDEALYAAANYRPYKAPMVWSDFITHYNLVLGVLSTFLLIVKFATHALHLFFPPVSVLIHVGLIAVYIVSASGQAGSDTSDPAHPQSGPPWYLTKSCSVAKDPDVGAYCKQAKTLFAFTIIIMVFYAVELGFSVHSCFVTKEEKLERDERREEKKTWKEYEEMALNSPAVIPPMSPAYSTGGPMSPGFPGMPSTTPRSLAFHRFDHETGSSDLPLRNNSSPQRSPSSMQQESDETLSPAIPVQAPGPIYFPPPPKKAAKK